MSKQPFTVTLTIRCGTVEAVRVFAVDAPTMDDAEKLAEQRMAHLPLSDRLHTEGDGGWLRVEAASVVPGHTPGAWHWEGGWNGQLVER